MVFGWDNAARLTGRSRRRKQLNETTAWAGVVTRADREPHQLTNCPWCGREINPGKDIIVETYEQGRGRTFQYCSDPLGRCP